MHRKDRLSKSEVWALSDPLTPARNRFPAQFRGHHLLKDVLKVWNFKMKKSYLLTLLLNRDVLVCTQGPSAICSRALLLIILYQNLYGGTCLLSLLTCGL